MSEKAFVAIGIPVVFFGLIGCLVLFNWFVYQLFTPLNYEWLEVAEVAVGCVG